jgi:hypothetical protein
VCYEQCEDETKMDSKQHAHCRGEAKHEKR